MRWMPHVTVAAIVEQGGRFLMVEERVEGRLVLNQPAGHLEDGEGLRDAVVRETYEETGWRFQPQAVVGLYRWRHPRNGETFLRIAFSGTCREHDPDRTLDESITRSLWLERGEILGEGNRLRSPLVMRGIDDYLAGNRYPLELLQDID
ncbi:MAG: NUDIX hydrolase [Gammaproteobacteria bacterium]